MRILTIVSDLGIGGTQRVAQNVTLGMKTRGASVAVLAHRALGPREESYRTADIPIFSIASDTSLDDAVRAAQMWRPDIVHIHRTGYANYQETKILAALRRDHAKIIETNVFGRFDRSDGGRYIDVHCLLSSWCYYKWNSWGGISSNKLSYIVPNAVNIESIVTPTDISKLYTRNDLCIPSGRFMFGRIGQPSEPKWSTSVFHAFRMVVELGYDIGLILVGAPAGYESEVQKLPAGIRERIILRPPTSHDNVLQQYLSAMDGFLHISDIGESFGMVLCEAMLAGLPIVTLSTPLKDNSQLEVVGHRQGGLIALSRASIPAAMVCLLRDSALREEIRLRARNWVASRFGVEVVTAKLEKIYAGVLIGKPPTFDDRSDQLPTREWIESIMSEGIGRPPAWPTRLMFHLVHDPSLYQFYQSLRQRLSRA